MPPEDRPTDYVIDHDEEFDRWWAMYQKEQEAEAKKRKADRLLAKTKQATRHTRRTF